ncbi:MAG: HNH endonuclease [Armatimonadetes bacterium]|nr:HNH endonuclease [Anaerolineae bacterium]
MTIGAAQRRLVRERAGACCEYCRLAEHDRLSSFHVDHIIPVKHGGTDHSANLCLACYKCNGYKGANVAGLDSETGAATKLYHPRLQHWDDHFEWKPDGMIIGLTPEGRTTSTVLRMNDTSRVQHREALLELGSYPCQK